MALKASDSGVVARDAAQHDERRHDGDDDDNADDEHDHRPAPRTAVGLTGTVPPVPESAPSAHTSCFQIGAEAFSASCSDVMMIAPAVVNGG